MIPCPLCPETCRDPMSLDLHIATHTKEKPYHCPLCAAAFGRQSSVNQHVREVHDGIKPVRNRNSLCHMCSYKCQSKSLLQEHMRKHFPEQPFCCTVIDCKFKTKYKSNLQQHVRTAHNDEKPFECPSGGCTYKTKTRQQLKSHLKRHSNEKPFACEFAGCNYKCKIRGNLKVHTLSAHMDEKPFVCLTCGVRSKSRSNLTRHQLVHTRIQRFQCQVSNCSFASKLRRNLQQHFDRKHRQKNVLCTEPGCNSKFGSVPLLKRHLKTQGSHTLKCPRGSCNYSTNFKTSLFSHISRRHMKRQPTTTVEPRTLDVSTDGTTHAVTSLRCRFPNCGYQTKFPYLYDRHKISHQREEKRDHVCSFCFFRCSKLFHLKQHIERHLGEKPYSCSHCNYAAVTSTELSQHAAKFHKIRVIPSSREDQVTNCRTCGKIFSSNHEFVLHSMSHLHTVVVLERLVVHVL